MTKEINIRHNDKESLIKMEDCSIKVSADGEQISFYDSNKSEEESLTSEGWGTLKLGDCIVKSCMNGKLSTIYSTVNNEIIVKIGDRKFKVSADGKQVVVYANDETVEANIKFNEDLNVLSLTDCIVKVRTNGKHAAVYSTTNDVHWNNTGVLHNNKDGEYCTQDGVKFDPVAAAAATAAAAAEGLKIKISEEGILTFILHGFIIKQDARGNLEVTSDQLVSSRPGLLNDQAIPLDNLAVGTKMADGTVFAGLTVDGTQRIFAMPSDLPILMTFNDAAKAVQNLNANKMFGHNDWEIPSLENLHILNKNREEGSLKGTFNMKAHEAGSFDFPSTYSSSTECPLGYLKKLDVRATLDLNAGPDWNMMSNLFSLSCRPVRLVDVLKP